jgi:hypothetical protein
VRELLDGYRSAGIRRLVALRGDLPSGAAGGAGDFRYANELVEFIRSETGDTFHIEVAAYPEAHPQSRSPADDLGHFVGKVAAGANSAITQYFYNPDAYFRFVDDAAALGCSVPIVPGIMPITNYVQLARFSDACGAEIPRWIRRRLESFGDDRDAIRAFGLDVVHRLCERLLERGAPGLHFYRRAWRRRRCRPRAARARASRTCGRRSRRRTPGGSGRCRKRHRESAGSPAEPRVRGPGPGCRTRRPASRRPDATGETRASRHRRTATRRSAARRPQATLPM